MAETKKYRDITHGIAEKLGDILDNKLKT